MIRTSIKLKLSIFLSIIIILVCVALSLSFFHRTKENMMDSFIRNGVVLAKNLAHNSRYGIITEDKTILDELINGVLQAEEIVHVTITDQFGKIIAQKSRMIPVLSIKNKSAFRIIEEAESNGIVSIESAVTENGEMLYLISSPVSTLPANVRKFPIELLEEEKLLRTGTEDITNLGVIQIGISPDLMNKKVREMWGAAIIITISIMTGGVICIYYLTRLYLKPLETLAYVAEKVSQGDLSQNAPPAGKDEVGTLTEVFNQMTHSLSLREKDCRDYIHQLERMNRKQAELNMTLENRVKERTEKLQQVVHQVRSEKMKTERILHEIDDGVIVLDQNGKTIMINPAARLMLMKEDHKEPDNAAADCPEYSDIEKVLLDHSGNSNLKAKSFPLRDNEGLLLGKIIVIHDVTHYMEVDRLKSEFVSHVSHELKTPLTSIKGYVDNLRDRIVGDLNERQEEYLERVGKNTDRLIRMIDDLLNISRIESGKMTLNFSHLIMSELIEEVSRGLRPLATQKKIEMSFMKSDGDGLVMADRDKIEQAVINLVNNAILYTPPGGKVMISMEHDLGYIKTSIRDTGIGIPTEEQPLIFDRFYRLEKDSILEPRGTGLGLYITRNVIEMHGGKIWVTSEVGKGSEFTFTLPA